MEFDGAEATDIQFNLILQWTVQPPRIFVRKLIYNSDCSRKEFSQFLFLSEYFGFLKGADDTILFVTYKCTLITLCEWL